MMKSKKLIAGILTAVSIMGGAVSVQAEDEAYAALQTEMDNRTNTLIGAIQQTAENLNTNIAGVQKNIETNLASVEQMARDGIDNANRKIDTNAGNIEQNKEDIAQNRENIAANATAIQNESDARASADAALQTEMDNRTNTLIGAIQQTAENLNANIAGVQKNIETNLASVEQMAQNGIDSANQKIDTNAGDIAQNKADIATIKKNWSDSERAFNAETVQQIDKNTDDIKTINENMEDGFNALNSADAQLQTNINKVEKDANKGIAKASALAALHPLDYDPNNKLDIAAAGGFYKGENAFALGAFYRPNRNVMLSIGTTISGDDNAYNVGVSFKVGKSGKHSEAGVSTAELYAMIGAMQEKMEQQQKRIEELEANQAK